MSNLSIETLKDWEKILKKYGFEPYSDNHVNGILTDIDWYNGDEHIKTCVYYTKNYLDSLIDGQEYNVDWNQCIVTDIIVYTNEFAYPEAFTESYDDWEGCIRLSKTTEYRNFSSLKYFEEALWMSRHPVEAKLNIAKNFIKHCKYFIVNILPQLEYTEISTNLLFVGEQSFTTEPYLVVKNRNFKEAVFTYNMFTDKLAFAKFIPNIFKGPRYEQINIDDITIEELKLIIWN